MWFFGRNRDKNETNRNGNHLFSEEDRKKSLVERQEKAVRSLQLEIQKRQLDAKRRRLERLNSQFEMRQMDDEIEDLEDELYQEPEQSQGSPVGSALGLTSPDLELIKLFQQLANKKAISTPPAASSPLDVSSFAGTGHMQPSYEEIPNDEIESMISSIDPSQIAALKKLSDTQLLSLGHQRFPGISDSTLNRMMERIRHG